MAQKYIPIAQGLKGAEVPHNAAINGAIAEQRLRIKWRSHAQAMRSLLHPTSWLCYRRLLQMYMMIIYAND
jgi:hypothetical protein